MFVFVCVLVGVNACVCAHSCCSVPGVRSGGGNGGRGGISFNCASTAACRQSLAKCHAVFPFCDSERTQQHRDGPQRDSTHITVARKGRHFACLEAIHMQRKSSHVHGLAPTGPHRT